MSMPTSLSGRLVLVVAAPALTVGLLAGCGSPAKPLSKADYIKQANAICRNSDAAGKKIVQPSGTPDAKKLATFVKQSADQLQTELDQLQKLVKPRLDRDELNTVYGYQRSQIATLRTAQAKFVAGDVSGGLLALGQSTAATQFASGVNSYGMTDCATGTD